MSPPSYINLPKNQADNHNYQDEDRIRILFADWPTGHDSCRHSDVSLDLSGYQAKPEPMPN